MSVLCRVMLAGFSGVMRGVIQVTFGDVCMVAGFFMIASFMMAGSGKMMFSGVLVVRRRFAMMLRGFFGHGKRPFRSAKFDAWFGNLESSLPPDNDALIAIP